MWLFLQTLGVIFVAELGDKTQFLMIAMASKYKVRHILIGVFSSILVLNIIAISLGALIGSVLPVGPIGIIAGLAFFYFALSGVNNTDEEESIDGKKRSGGEIFAIFGTFFIAELGDKTQLTALAIAAEKAGESFDLLITVLVLAGAVIGLFAADVLGLVVGYFLGKKLPDRIFSYISYAIFAVFGVVKLISGFEEVYKATAHPVLYMILSTVVIGVLFIVASIYIIFIKPKKQMKK